MRYTHFFILLFFCGCTSMTEDEQSQGMVQSPFLDETIVQKDLWETNSLTNKALIDE